jgi:hypothetical protein
VVRLLLERGADADAGKLLRKAAESPSITQEDKNNIIRLLIQRGAPLRELPAIRECVLDAFERAKSAAASESACEA